MTSSSWASARDDHRHSEGGAARLRTGGTRTDGLAEFAAWVENLMRERGYVIDGPRSGGKSKLADDAGVHRAAVTRLLQRQSMPDLETMRRLAVVLGVPLRDMLIRSGRLSETDLPLYEARGEDEQRPQWLSPEEAARRMGVPAELRDLFVRVVTQFLPHEGSGASAGGA